jgi:hypothetical protein
MSSSSSFKGRRSSGDPDADARLYLDESGLLQGLQAVMEHLVEARDLNRDVLLQPPNASSSSSSSSSSASPSKSEQGNSNSSSSGGDGGGGGGADLQTFIAEQTKVFDMAADELEKFGKQWHKDHAH